MKHKNTIEVLMLMVISFSLSGCIGFQPFPLAARSGDTVALALGGTLNHQTVPGGQITLNDLDIAIQQDKNGNGIIDSDETFTVSKRYLFRLYPDATCNDANFNGYSTPVGQWSAVVDLADPSTKNPLPLVENRQATIVVNTDKLKKIWGIYEGSLTNIPITILPGTGQSHNFNNDPIVTQADIANLQPLPQLAVGFTGTVNVAAAARDIDYDKTVLFSPSYIKIKQDISQQNVILNQRIYSDNGNTKMRIILATNSGTVSPG